MLFLGVFVFFNVYIFKLILVVGSTSLCELLELHGSHSGFLFKSCKEIFRIIKPQFKSYFLD